MSNTQDKAIEWLMDRTDKVGVYIEELAKNLGVAAKHVYEVMVQFQVADGIGLLIQASIWFVVALLLALFNIKILIKKAMRDPYHPNENEWRIRDDEAGFFIGILIVVIFIVVTVLLYHIVGDVRLGVQKLISPEYYALKDIMDFVKDAAKKD